ncbi:MAG: hypothetical protein RIC89_07050 [Pseudomonadales bacterium]
MSEEKLFNWIQIATGIAVVVGLIMVFIELRQAKSLSLAELTSEGYAEALADFRTVMGENPAPVIAKSCYEPANLAAEELIILNAYYNSKIAQVTRLRVLEQVADFGVPWEQVAQQQLLDVMATEPGRKWFENQARSDKQLYDIGMQTLAYDLDCKSFLSSIAILPESVLD